MARGAWVLAAGLATGLVSMLGAAPAFAQGHILFDLSHGEAQFSNPFDNGTQGWGLAMNELVGAGYTWSVIPEGGSITPQALEGSSFLIVAEPLTSFTSAEVAAVLDFVQAGGGLLLANDFNAPINDLSVPTDVFYLLGPTSGFATVTDIVGGHPVTEGIDQIDWPEGTPLLVGPSVVTLASFQGQPVLAAQEFDAGRIVYVGDNELFAGYGITNPENTPLLLNIAGWLAADVDADGDGVGNADDLCPGTPAGVPVDVKGCSYPQRQEAACPVTGDYRNHGAYVSCVAHAAHQAVKDGLITKREAAAAVVAAAQSDVGKKDCDKGGKHDKCKKHGKHDNCDKGKGKKKGH